MQVRKFFIFVLITCLASVILFTKGFFSRVPDVSNNNSIHHLVDDSPDVTFFLDRLGQLTALKEAGPFIVQYNSDQKLYSIHKSADIGKNSVVVSELEELSEQGQIDIVRTFQMTDSLPTVSIAVVRDKETNRIKSARFSIDGLVSYADINGDGSWDVMIQRLDNGQSLRYKRNDLTWILAKPGEIIDAESVLVQAVSASLKTQVETPKAEGDE